MRTQSATPAEATSLQVANAADLLDRRISGISQWLKENCPECTSEQRHLDEGTRERQYWHYGYLVALRDVQKLLGLDAPPVN